MVLTGKIAVVTGSSNGIGAAITRTLRAHGATVVGIDLAPASTSVDAPDVFVEGDVTSEETWSRATDAARELGSWDVLVNNAALQIEENILDTTPENFARVLDVNVVSALRGIRAARASMTSGGSIVNIGSIVGFTADPLLGAYPASKGAVLNLTRTVALALGRERIRVNAVSPGSVLTPLTTRILDLAEDPQAARDELFSLSPMGEIATPEEVANVVAFLASDLSSGVSGSNVVVDKGLTAANPEWAISARLMNEERTKS